MGWITNDVVCKTFVMSIAGVSQHKDISFAMDLFAFEMTNNTNSDKKILIALPSVCQLLSHVRCLA